MSVIIHWLWLERGLKVTPLLKRPQCALSSLSSLGIILVHISKPTRIPLHRPFIDFYIDAAIIPWMKTIVAAAASDGDSGNGDDVSQRGLDAPWMHSLSFLELCRARFWTCVYIHTYATAYVCRGSLFLDRPKIIFRNVLCPPDLTLTYVHGPTTCGRRVVMKRSFLHRRRCKIGGN